MWVVYDPQKARKQPFLEIAQTAKKLTEKPTNSVQPGKEDELEPFDEVVKDCQKLEGIFSLYSQKDKNKIHLEIKPAQLQKTP